MKKNVTKLLIFPSEGLKEAVVLLVGIKIKINVFMENAAIRA